MAISFVSYYRLISLPSLFHPCLILVLYIYYLPLISVLSLSYFCLISVVSPPISIMPISPRCVVLEIRPYALIQPTYSLFPKRIAYRRKEHEAHLAHGYDTPFLSQFRAFLADNTHFIRSNATACKQRRDQSRAMPNSMRRALQLLRHVFGQIVNHFRNHFIRTFRAAQRATADDCFDVDTVIFRERRIAP